MEVAGISNRVFLRTAFNSICKHQGIAPLDEKRFDELLDEKAKDSGNGFQIFGSPCK